MDWFIELLKSTVEYCEFTASGFSSPSVLTALATAVITCLQGYGAWAQGGTIWRKRSVERVSSVMVISGVGFFFAFMVYGASRGSLAMMFNGLLGFVFLRAMAGLWRFGEFGRKEWFYTLFFLSYVPIMVLVEDKEHFLLFAIFSLLFGAIPQTVEAYRGWRIGDPGALEPKFIAMFMVSNVFWFSYGSVVGDWVLQAFNPFSFTNLSIALLFWYLAKRKAERMVIVKAGQSI